MEPWIGLTLLGVLIQSGRTVLQKRLVGRLSVGGATYARFLYGAPLAWLMVGLTIAASGGALPRPGALFFAYVVAGGFAQILGNAIFISLIRGSNFTVITTYSKTETVMGALISFIVLGDVLSIAGLCGVLVTVAGVVVLAAGNGSLTWRGLVASLAAKDMLFGVAVGALYAVGSTAYRGAILTLGGDDRVLASLFTLACVSFIQAVCMGAWLAARQPAVLRETLRSWRAACWIGITGAGASAAWYMAFSQQVTAYVLAVGQVELVITFLYSHYLFKERVSSGELAGIFVTLAGILLVVLAP